MITGRADMFFSSMFLKKILRFVVYALVGVSSLLLVVKINQSRKLLKVIFFRHTLESGMERGF